MSNPDYDDYDRDYIGPIRRDSGPLNYDYDIYSQDNFDRVPSLAILQ